MGKKAYGKSRVKLAKPQETKSTIRFDAKLFRPKATEKIGSWTLLTLPNNASAKVPSGGMTMVEGTINGFPFRGVLEPNGEESHSLKVNKALQDATGADAGDTVTVEITRAGEEPETRVPMELRKALAAAPPAQALWAAITPMARQNWILWISSAKLPETRMRRIEMLFWRSKVADERSPNIKRRMASAAELKKSCFGEIDRVENHEERLRLDVYSSGSRPIFRFRYSGPTRAASLRFAAANLRRPVPVAIVWDRLDK